MSTPITDRLLTSFEDGEPLPPTDQSGPTAQLTDALDPPAQVQISVGHGPLEGYVGAPGQGSTGVRAVRVEGIAGTPGVGVLVAQEVQIGADTRLRYRVHPAARAGGEPDRYLATYLGVDLELADGTVLSLRDQYGVALDARAQGEAKHLWVGQWNEVTCDLDSSLAGQVVTRILVRFDAPGSSLPAGSDEGLVAWIDDVALAPIAVLTSNSDADDTLPENAAASPADLVDTRRGSHSTFHFSRGNTFPATALPNGFTLTSPMTASALDWLYSWSAHNTPEGRTPFHGFVLSHQPSPWMGDRNQIIINAAPIGSDSPATFSHDNEVARPFHYGLTRDDGVVAEAVPTDHGAALRFTAADSIPLHLTITGGDGESHVALDAEAGIATGWVDGGSVLSVGRSRLYFYAVIDTAPGPADTSTLTVRIATSHLGADQARHAWNLEFTSEAGSLSWQELRDLARATWHERLRVLEIPGATPEQAVTAYSNLYRLNLYPTAHHENVGTNEEPEYRYASPVLPAVGPSSDTETGAAIRSGRSFVNHGFWDTYRTAWPLYALVYPEIAADLADGFVEQFRTAGWISRWASPGYADLMTGTSSDVAFADLYLKGVPLPDPQATYCAGLRNATVLPPAHEVGRKDLRATAFRGFPEPEVHEPVSWAFEASLNDAGLAEMARGIAAEPGLDTGVRRRLIEEADYLARRALSYRHGFDASTGFFQSRRHDGTFRTPAADYRADRWGGDYTEANGWTFAFPAPHDGAGLAALYGGPDGLRAKLDEFFATPETTLEPGTYPGHMHEITEARDTRLGQCALSNQPAHHIPFLYAFTGSPQRTSAVVHDALDRLFVGASYGQGYPGDEDNGEMSAWYLFAASGLYPLQVGTSQLTLHAPYFPELTWHLPGGDLVVRRSSPPAGEGAGTGVPTAISRVLLNGREHVGTWIEHADLSGGATLEVVTTDGPTTWGTSATEAPPSIAESPLGPWRDLATSAGAATPAAATLADDDAHSSVDLADEQLTWAVSDDSAITAYTMTCGDDAGSAPASWILEASRDDGASWQVLDERGGEFFDWPSQIRPFTPSPVTDVAAPDSDVPGGNVTHYRLTFPTGGVLRQVELLA